MAENAAPVATPPADPPAAPPGDPPAFKFADQSAAEKAATDAQAKITQQAQELAALKAAKAPPTADPNNPLDAPPPPAISDDTDFRGMVQAAGYKPEDVYQKWAAGEDLTEFHKAMSKAGNVPLAVVKQTTEAVLQLEKTNGERAQAAVNEVAGGEDQWATLRDWARQNIPEAELNAYREQMKDPVKAKIAARMIMEQHTQAIGADGAQPLAAGTTPQPGSSAGFATNHEMRLAMKEAKQKYGSWNKDAALMKRLEATDPSIQTAY